MALSLLFVEDWKMFFIGEHEPLFLLEVFIRTVLMFLVILVALRILGKRSVSQLSVFELGVIIGLGSAAGDPMFNKDIGLLPCLLVFGVIIGMSRLLTLLINKSDKLEKKLEGEPVYLVEDGRLLYKEFKAEPVAQNELFSQLRLNSVSHLGQVKTAIVESNGTVSIFYLADEDVKWGLPVLPHLLDRPLTIISGDGTYACVACSLTKELAPGPPPACGQCGCQKWVRAQNEKRIN